jgi:glutathione S-transferase
MLELYHHGTSVCAAKPRIVLAEKKAEWTPHYVDILAGEQFRPEYMKLNPNAVVPTLVHDGNVILESTVICEYLDEILPDPPLKPASALERARMRIWNKRIDEQVHPNTTPVTYAISHRHVVISHGPSVVEEYINKMGPAAAVKRRRRIELGIEDEDARAALKVWDRFLADMETRLSRHQWLAGDAFSLAEACVIPFINRLDMLQLSFMWEDNRPGVTDWFRRMKAKPWFEGNMYGYCPAPLRALMREKGLEAQPRAREIVAGAGA